MDHRRVDVIWVWAGRIMLVGLTTFATAASSAWGALSDRVADNSESVEVLRSTQFTTQQAAELEGRLVSRMQEPPRWLTESVGRLERAAERIDLTVSEMQQRLVRLEATLDKR